MNKSARKPAPAITVEEVFKDERAAIISDLNTSNPDFVHSFQDGSVKQETLRRNGQEVVKGDDGAEVRVGGDIVVRQSKEAYARRRMIQAEQSFQSVARSRKESEHGTIRQFASPKKETKEE